MDSFVANSADPNAYIQLLPREILAKKISSMNFSRNQMMKLELSDLRA